MEKRFLISIKNIKKHGSNIILIGNIYYKFGGLYVDMDYKCLNRFDDYLIKHKNYDIFLNERPYEVYKIFKKNVCNSLIISTKKNNQFLKLLIDSCFERIKTYSPFYHVYYVVNTTGPGLINDTLKTIDKNKKYKAIANKIHILPFSQFNFCNNCNICQPSKDKKLYAVHDYRSYWTSDFWLRIRKLFSCTTRENLMMIVVIIIIILFTFLKLKK